MRETVLIIHFMLIRTIINGYKYLESGASLFKNNEHYNQVGKAPASYLKGSMFKCLPGRQLSRLEFLIIFPQSLQSVE
jgi:hypothetical protein